jgi:hypothetical protein
MPSTKSGFLQASSAAFASPADNEIAFFLPLHLFSHGDNALAPICQVPLWSTDLHLLLHLSSHRQISTPPFGSSISLTTLDQLNTTAATATNHTRQQVQAPTDRPWYRDFVR